MYKFQVLFNVLLCMSIDTSTGPDDAEGNVVWPTSLGAVFHPVTRINNANSAWLHVYKVPRLKPLALPGVPDMCEAIAFLLYNWNFESANTSVPMLEPPHDDGTMRDSPSKIHSQIFTDNPTVQMVYADNYLYQQCQKYQITTSTLSLPRMNLTVVSAEPTSTACMLSQ